MAAEGTGAAPGRDRPLGLIATVRAQAGREHDLERLLLGLCDWVRANEPGTLRYDLYAVRDAPGVYKIVEEFASEAAWEAHRSAERVRTTIAEVHAVLADKSAEFTFRVVPSA